MKKIIYKSIYIFSIIIIIYLLIYICSKNPTQVENIYSTTIYATISLFFCNIYNVFPFSVTELLITLAIITLLITLYLLIRRFSVTKLINYFLNILIIFSTGVFLFWLLWGINNYRLPLQYSISYDNNKLATKNSYTVEELVTTCEYLVDKANYVRAKISEDENGIATISGGYKEIFNYVSKAYEISSEKNFFKFSSSVLKPKPMLFSRIMSNLNYTGMFNPFFYELNINVNEPIFNMPATVCHEVAHLKGYSKENEANFISFVTCINSKNPYFEYSGYILGLIHCTNTLYDYNPDAYYTLVKKYSSGLKRDLKYQNEYWNKYKNIIATIGEVNNNIFLKSTNQPEGVKSYGLVVDLIISYIENNSIDI